MKTGIQIFLLIGAVLLALIVGFSAGLLFNQQMLIPVSGFFDPDNRGSASTPIPDELDHDLLEEAYETIMDHYADRESLQDTNLTYSAISGMVEALGDTGHSRFMTPEMVEAERRQIQGEFEGIGALLNVNDAGNPVILAPMDNSPAQNAGLQPGDIILEVDGVDVSTSPLNEVVDRVIGPAGTEVTLTVMDPDSEEVREVTITRAKITIQNVTWQMLPGTQIAHIRIAAYSQNVSDALRDAITEAKQQGAQGILLDLRNNPGGLLHEAVSVVSQFLDEGNVLQTKDASGRVRSTRVERGGLATDIPMVVLINEGSASASEITAGALQDYERATLVGQKTFGTGTVLNQFRLSDGSAILLATELWLTPKGRAIWHEGIEPDVTVEMPADATISIPETERDLTAEELKNLEDPQLLKGLELLQKELQ